jgi:biopolymer transport protein ExbD
MGAHTRAHTIAAIQAHLSCDPFVDVMLVLLMIFVPLLPISRMVDVYPEQPAPNAIVDSEADIYIGISSSGQYTIDDVPLSDSELGARLREIYRVRPMKQAVIAGNRGAKWQRVFSAMDTARAAGVRVLIFPRDPR